MKSTSVRPTDCMEKIVQTYGNMLFRLCLVTLGNVSDAEDAVQETFIKYLQKAPKFENAASERAQAVAGSIWKGVRVNGKKNGRQNQGD